MSKHINKSHGVAECEQTLYFFNRPHPARVLTFRWLQHQSCMRPSIRNEVGPLLLLSHCKCYQIIRNIDLYCFIRQATAVRINSSALPGYLFSTICIYAVFAAFASCGNSHFRSTSRNVNTTSPTMHMHCSRASI